MSGTGVDRTGAGFHTWHAYSQRIPPMTSHLASPSDVIVIHGDSSEPELDLKRKHMAATSTTTPTTAVGADSANYSGRTHPTHSLAAAISHYASSQHPSLTERSHIDSPPNVAIAAAASASAPNSILSTIGNNFSQLSLPSMRNAETAAATSTTPHVYDSLAYQQSQPRYMTRSVAQNAARRKQEQLKLENKQQLGEIAALTPSAIHDTAAAMAASPANGRFAFRGPAHAGMVDAVAAGQSNPYYMVDYRSQFQQQHQQQQQQQTLATGGPWSSAALYHAARAVAAADASTVVASQLNVPTLASSFAAAAQQTQNAEQQLVPAPKRRKNAAAALVVASAAGPAPAAKPAVQRAPRGRATTQ
ncbi:hypothetical protein GGF37_002899, partial [Kickxella alabastrina]